MSPEPAGVLYDGSLDCTYTISVYPGYGVELKVSRGLRAGWGAECLQASVACPPLHAMAAWPCGVQQTHGPVPVLAPVPMFPSQEKRLRALPALRSRRWDAAAWAGGMRMHGMLQDAPCPPAATGQHRGLPKAGGEQEAAAPRSAPAPSPHAAVLASAAAHHRAAPLN